MNSPVGEPIVLHQDEELVAVDKPPGMATAAGGGIEDEASLHAWVTRRLGTRIWIVHRLDRDTSGVIVFAKTAEAHRRLSQAFEGREVGKRYLAVVDGHVGRATGTIDQPLRAFGSGRVGVDPKGSEAVTRFRRLERLHDADLLEVEPLSGRRHQIRVHCYAIGHPVLGDTRYGANRPVGGASRLMLHAVELRLPTEAGEPLVLRADPPRAFEAVLDGLR